MVVQSRGIKNKVSGFIDCFFNFFCVVSFCIDGCYCYFSFSNVFGDCLGQGVGIIVGRSVN